MLLLEDRNRIIESSLKGLKSGELSGDSLDIKFSDFGETNCWFHPVDNDNAENFRLSIKFPAYSQLSKLGLKDHLEKYVGGLAVIVKSESGYDLTLQFQKDSINDELVTKLALLRRKCLALPLELAMDASQATEIVSVPLGGSDIMFVAGGSDRVTVVLATQFDDPSDAILGKVFIQEFYDQRTQVSLQNTPAVLYGKEPPLEVKNLIPQSTNENVNYITLILFPPHYTEKKREKCISTVLNFRDYFHYHIKCSKAFMHSRMRGKVSEFLKMLNRTKSITK